MATLQTQYAKTTIPFRPPGPVLHFSELTPAPPDSPLAEEWETFRRELPELLAKGLAGKHVLIVGAEIQAISDSFAEAVAEGRRRFPNRPIAVQLIAEWQPVIRPTGGIRWAA
jgi:hypothetical protein